MVTYAIIAFDAGTAPPVLGFLAGLGAHRIHLLFYIALTLMLGAVFNKRGPVIADPLVFLFSQQLLMGAFPALSNVLPWTVAIPPESSTQPPVALAVMTGAEALSYLPLVTTVAASALFVAIALWRFQRQEF